MISNHTETYFWNDGSILGRPILCCFVFVRLLLSSEVEGPPGETFFFVLSGRFNKKDYVLSKTRRTAHADESSDDCLNAQNGMRWLCFNSTPVDSYLLGGGCLLCDPILDEPFNTWVLLAVAATRCTVGAILASAGVA